MQNPSFSIQKSSLLNAIAIIVQYKHHAPQVYKCLDAADASEKGRARQQFIIRDTKSIIIDAQSMFLMHNSWILL